MVWGMRHMSPPIAFPWPSHGRYRTKLCENFNANGQCPFLATCSFAHGYEAAQTLDPPALFCRPLPLCPLALLLTSPFWSGGAPLISLLLSGDAPWLAPNGTS